MKQSEDKRPTVQVEYDAEKLEALRFYLRDRKTTVEQELVDAIDALYKKDVPSLVRDYIERKNAPPAEDTGSERQM